MAYIPGAVSGARNDLADGGGLMLIKEASGLNVINNTISVPFDVNFDAVEKVVVVCELHSLRTSGDTGSDTLSLTVLSDPAHMWGRSTGVQGYSNASGGSAAVDVHTRAAETATPIVRSNRTTAGNPAIKSSGSAEITMDPAMNQLTAHAIFGMHGSSDTTAYRTFVQHVQSSVPPVSRRLTMAVVGTSTYACDYSVRVYVQSKVKSIDTVAYEVLYDGYTTAGGMPAGSFALNDNDELIIEGVIAPTDATAGADLCEFFVGNTYAENAAKWQSCGHYQRPTAATIQANAYTNLNAMWLGHFAPIGGVFPTGHFRWTISVRKASTNGMQLTASGAGVARDGVGPYVWTGGYNCIVDGAAMTKGNLQFSARCAGWVRVLRAVRVDLLTNAPDTLHGLKVAATADKAGITVAPGCVEILGRVHHLPGATTFAALSGIVRAGETLPTGAEAYLYAVSMPDRTLQFKVSGTPPTLDRYGNVVAAANVDYDTSSHHPIEGRMWRCVARLMLDATGKVLAAARSVYAEVDDLTVREGVMDELLLDFQSDTESPGTRTFPFSAGDSLVIEADLYSADGSTAMAADITFGAAAGNTNKYVRTTHYASATAHSYSSGTSSTLNVIYGGAETRSTNIIRLFTKPDGSGNAYSTHAPLRTDANARLVAQITTVIAAGAHMLEGYGTLVCNAATRGRIRIYRRARARAIVSNPGMRSGLALSVNSDGLGLTVGKGVCEISAKAYENAAPLNVLLTNIRSGDVVTNSAPLYLYGKPAANGALECKFAAAAPRMDMWGDLAASDSAIDYSLPCYHPVEGRTWRWLGTVTIDSTGKITGSALTSVAPPPVLEGSVTEVIYDEVRATPGGAWNVDIPTFANDSFMIEADLRTPDDGNASSPSFMIYANNAADSLNKFSHLFINGAGSAVTAATTATAPGAGFTGGLRDIGGIWRVTVAEDKRTCRVELDGRYKTTAGAPSRYLLASKGVLAVDITKFLLVLAPELIGHIRITRLRPAAVATPQPDLLSGLDISVTAGVITVGPGCCEVSGYTLHNRAPLPVPSLAAILRSGDTLPTNGTVYLYGRRGNSDMLDLRASTTKPRRDRYGNVVADYTGMDLRRGLYHEAEGGAWRYLGAASLTAGAVTFAARLWPDAPAFSQMLQKLVSRELVLEKYLTDATTEFSIPLDGLQPWQLEIESDLYHATGNGNVVLCGMKVGADADNTNAWARSYFLGTSATVQSGNIPESLLHLSGAQNTVNASTLAHIRSDPAIPWVEAVVAYRTLSTTVTIRNHLVYLHCSNTMTPDKRTSLRFIPDAAARGVIRVYRNVQAELVTAEPDHRTGLVAASTDGANITVGPGSIEIMGNLLHNRSPQTRTLAELLRAGETWAAATAYYLYAVSEFGVLSFKASALPPTLDRFGNTLDFATADLNMALHHPVEGRTWRYIGYVSTAFDTATLVPFVRSAANTWTGAHMYADSPAAAKPASIKVPARAVVHAALYWRLGGTNTPFMPCAEYISTGATSYGAVRHTNQSTGRITVYGQGTAGFAYNGTAWVTSGDIRMEVTF